MDAHFSLLFLPFRGCDGKGSLHEPHGGAGLWSHRPGPGPSAPGRPGWAWAGAERASSSSQSLSTAGVYIPWTGLLCYTSPLLIQTWAMNPPQQSCLDLIPDSSWKQGWASMVCFSCLKWLLSSPEPTVCHLHTCRQHVQWSESDTSSYEVNPMFDTGFFCCYFGDVDSCGLWNKIQRSDGGGWKVVSSSQSYFWLHTHKLFTAHLWRKL